MTPSKMRPALIGGLVFGVASGLPIIGCINLACCLLLVGGGVLAAYLYQKDCPQPVEYGDAAILGAITGVIGGVVDTLVSIPISLISIPGIGTGTERIPELLDQMNLPPEIRDIIEQIALQEAIAGGIILMLLLNLIFWIIFATIGAIIGVAIFQKTDAVPAVPPSPPPEPPMSG